RGHCEPAGAGPEPPAGMRERGVRDDRRSDRVEREPEREREGRPDPWVVPLDKEPAEGRGGEQRTEPAVRPPRPGRKPDREQSPAGHKLKSPSSSRPPGERVGGLAARDGERESAERETDRPEKTPSNALPSLRRTHAVIVAEPP